MPRVLELDVKVREPPGIEIGGSPLAAGKMTVLSRDASLLRAVRRSTVMVLGGEPVGEPLLELHILLPGRSPSGRRGLSRPMRIPSDDDQEFTPTPDHVKIVSPTVGAT